MIIATGGIEQNGPYLALGKHNYILRTTTERTARKLGKAIVVPIEKTRKIAKQLIDYQADVTIAGIRKAIASTSKAKEQ